MLEWYGKIQFTWNSHSYKLKQSSFWSSLLLFDARISIMWCLDLSRYETPIKQYDLATIAPAPSLPSPFHINITIIISFHHLWTIGAAKYQFQWRQLRNIIGVDCVVPYLHGNDFIGRQGHIQYTIPHHHYSLGILIFWYESSSKSNHIVFICHSYSCAPDIILSVRVNSSTMYVGICLYMQYNVSVCQVVVSFYSMTDWIWIRFWDYFFGTIILYAWTGRKSLSYFALFLLPSSWSSSSSSSPFLGKKLWKDVLTWLGQGRQGTRRKKEK